MIVGSVVFGCSDPEAVPCDDEDDCFDKEVCENGYCTAIDEASESGDSSDGNGDEACFSPPTTCGGAPFSGGSSYEFHDFVDDRDSLGCDGEGELHEEVLETEEFTLCSGGEHRYYTSLEVCEEATYEVVFRLQPTIECSDDVLEEIRDSISYQLFGVGLDCDDYYVIDCPEIEEGEVVIRYRVEPGEPGEVASSAMWKPTVEVDGDFHLDYRVELSIEEFEE